MPTYKGVPGRKKDIAVDSYATSVTDAIRKLHDKLQFASAAGDEGALNVYRDDKGGLRGQFMRYRMTVDEQVFPSVNACRKWLVEFWPRLGRD